MLQSQTALILRKGFAVENFQIEILNSLNHHHQRRRHADADADADAAAIFRNRKNTSVGKRIENEIQRILDQTERIKFQL